MKFVSVYDEPRAVELLYRLLSEREHNVSHRRMPTMAAHRRFVISRPYRYWYLIEADERYVGAIYLGHNNEIGIGILKEFQGNRYGQQACGLLITKHKPLKGIRSIRSKYFIANINPENETAIRMFQSLGFRHIQNTYELS
jgi:RimJ/RimL family protein N-acetyltransferase